MVAHGPVAVIIGMPGAGKTRVGREAAMLLGVDFVDADFAIEQHVGMRIPEYFERHGEAAFRALECKVVLELLSQRDGVISLGGGAPITETTREALSQYARNGGKVVYLEADPTEAMERARRGGNRPMLSGDADARWNMLFEQRHPIFSAIANRRVRTHGLTPQIAARKLKNMINERVIRVEGRTIEPYDVRIGQDAMLHIAAVLGNQVAQVALIHTQTVQRHSDHMRTLLRQAGYEVTDVIIPDAEAGKTVHVAQGIWTKLAQSGFTRSDAIVGLGGGAATDLAGFVAATWMRGIRYVNCPTSLLAMVDASTGGKTGVNIPDGKNLVGSFYTPAGVLADTKALSTLPNDIFVEGLGEVVKSGFIKDSQILTVLHQHAVALRQFDGNNFLDSPLEDVVAELIERTVTVKAYHVSQDLKESGIREYLNYGHTLAHAIEKIEDFRWRHGNAVAVGCMFAAYLANILGYLDNEAVRLHADLLNELGLPTTWDGGSWDEVLTLMHRDKKARGKTLRFIVLDGIGNPIAIENPPIDALQEAFSMIRTGERQ